MAAMHKATCTRPGCGLACSSTSVDDVMAWSVAHDEHCPSLKAQEIAPRLVAEAEKRGAVKALRELHRLERAGLWVEGPDGAAKFADAIQSGEVTL